MKYFLIIFSVVFLTTFTKAQTSCTNCFCFVNNSLSWNVEHNDSRTLSYLVRGDSLKGRQLSIDALFSQVKNAYGIKTKIAKIEGSTVYIEILNIKYLQQRSYETLCDYSAVMVFTLTENPKCKRVYLDFTENGDMGTAAFFKREDFYRNKYYIICNKK